MNTCRMHRFGSPDVITLENIEKPKPGDGEVVARIKAAGAGPWDARIRAGKSALPQPLPLTLGSDLSGVIEAIGPKVTAFEPGDPVFGVTNSRFTGAYAEFAVTSAGMIAKKPHRISDIDASSAPVVVITAWQALFDPALLAGARPFLSMAQRARTAPLRFGSPTALDFV
jgi:NADPH:quinone reductase-like Zn-dependent oxidoreductase